MSSATEDVSNENLLWTYYLPPRTLGSPKCALIRNSRAPPSCLIFQTNADLSGAYWTVPVEACQQPQISCIARSIWYTYAELWAVRIIRHGDIDLDIVCSTPPLELRLYFDHKLDSTTLSSEPPRSIAISP